MLLFVNNRSSNWVIRNQIFCVWSRHANIILLLKYLHNLMLTMLRNQTNTAPLIYLVEENTMISVILVIALSFFLHKTAC
jgi:hypothetical protein